MLKSKFIIIIECEFKRQIINIFGNNVEFAFIFGSIAKGIFQIQKSDIDTFVCLKTNDLQKVRDFEEWIISFQYQLNLSPDLKYPSEIVTYQFLESVIKNLEDIRVAFSYSDLSVFDRIFWVCILSSFRRKQAFIGGKEGRIKLSNLVKKFRPYPKKWGEQFIKLFDQNEEVPVSIQKHYQNLDKQAIREKLTKLLAEHEYCEIMRLVELNVTNSINT